MNLNIFRLWSISFLKKIALWKLFLLAHREWTVGCLCISYINLKSTLRVCVHRQFFSFFSSFFFFSLFCVLKALMTSFTATWEILLSTCFCYSTELPFSVLYHRVLGFTVILCFHLHFCWWYWYHKSCLVCTWLVKGEVTLTSAMLTQKLNCLQLQALPVKCKKDV